MQDVRFTIFLRVLLSHSSKLRSHIGLKFVSDLDIRIWDLSMTVCYVVGSYHSTCCNSFINVPWFFDGGVDPSLGEFASDAKQTNVDLWPNSGFPEA